MTIGVTVGLLLALIAQRAEPGAAAHLPRAAHPAVGDAQLHHRAHLEGHVPPAVRRGEPRHPHVRRPGPVRWFDSPLTSFLTALATNGWLGFPFMMVVSLGALAVHPQGALRGGARGRGQPLAAVPAITLPSLKPALVPAIILSVVWTFNMFNIIYLVTGGEPGGSTEILVTQAYKFAFQRYRYGYAAAYSTVIFGILLLYSVVQNRMSPRHGGRPDGARASRRLSAPAAARRAGGLHPLHHLPHPLGGEDGLLRPAEPGHRHAAGGPHVDWTGCAPSPRGRSTGLVVQLRVGDDGSAVRAVDAQQRHHRRGHHGGGRVPGRAPRPTPSAASSSPASARA